MSEDPDSINLKEIRGKEVPSDEIDSSRERVESMDHWVDQNISVSRKKDTHVTFSVSKRALTLVGVLLLLSVGFMAGQVTAWKTMASNSTQNSIQAETFSSKASQEKTLPKVEAQTVQAEKSETSPIAENIVDEKKQVSSQINPSKIAEKPQIATEAKKAEIKPQVPYYVAPKKPVVTAPPKIKAELVQIHNPTIDQNPQLHTATMEHEHPKITLDYPTMGIPKVGETFNFQQVFDKDLYRYEAEMDEDTDCELERYGDYGDGGYLVCKNFLNQSAALINLGVQGRDLFGCGLTSHYPMPNYQYDCTNSYMPPCETNLEGNHFQLACLGEKTEKTQFTQFYSLKDIVDSRNLVHKHVTMKIDIEGGEWPGFRTFPLEYLDYVDQFILEIHNPGAGQHQGTYWGNVDIIKSLGEKFVSVNLHMNNFACLPVDSILSKARKFPSFAIEVTMVNKKIIKLKSQKRSYALHGQNHLNTNIQDCQMHD